MENDSSGNNSFGFKSINFYGRKRTKSPSKDKFENLLKKIDTTEKFIKRNPIKTPGICRINAPDSTWKIFSRLNSALQYCIESCRDVMTFSYESTTFGHEGQRKFLVCHPTYLWQWQQVQSRGSRCSYEVIPENKPCKIYLDLEFDKTINPSHDGNIMTDILIKVILYYLKELFQIECNESDVIYLESSTPTKFSHHLIINNQNCIFENNYHLGSFIDFVLNEINSIINDESNCLILGISKTDLNALYVLDKDTTKIFVDRGVYTKNRNFRILSSTKLGKNVPLIISHRSPYIAKVPSDSNISKDELLFLDTLVSYIPFQIEKYIKFEKNINNDCSSSYLPKSDNHVSYEKWKESPFVEIDNFINSIIEDGYIRSWHYFDKELLVYEIGRYRFCNNIGRHHKSNGIMYVVDLKAGIYYQKCHDPECEGFRSKESILPTETMPWKLFTEFDMDENVFSTFEEDDESFMQIVEKIEENLTP